MSKLDNPNMEIQKFGSELYVGIVQIIENARKRTALFLNAETTLMYWGVGNYINNNLKTNDRTQYGAKILATLSQLLSWSHFIELAAIDNELKRGFYTQLNVYERWGIRELRDKIDSMLFEPTALSTKPEEAIQSTIKQLEREQILSPELVFKNSYVLDFLNLPANYTEQELENALITNIEKFILELGNGFAFVERQKRISIDSIDYHLDLLFYHRKLKRLVAIDLKLGKFKLKHKAQMELYLRWLQKHEMQQGEEAPIGLLLCSEGNTEHIELLMLDQNDIKVAQYLTELPSKEWFADKMHRALEIAKQYNQKNEED